MLLSTKDGLRFEPRAAGTDTHEASARRACTMADFPPAFGVSLATTTSLRP